MVAVTGSLAMNNTEEGKDIDYMLVTAPDRLWTCRALTLLIARFAKLEGISLCPNYLVTTNALELNEHSLYVAHELAQMIPLSGMEVYDEMRRLNAWMDEVLPNAIGSSVEHVMLSAAKHLYDSDRDSSVAEERSLRVTYQKVFEFILALPTIHWFEKWEMNRKIKKLSREQSSSSESNFSVDVCKGHVDKHGKKTEEAMMNRVTHFPHPRPLPVGEGVRAVMESPLPSGEGK
jgi:hypothetical protein